MTRLDETEISKAILGTYHSKIAGSIVSDVLVAGAGPAGLVAALHLAKGGFKTTIFEKRLAPGGGVWGGGMGMNDVVVQEEALPILDEVGVRHQHVEGPLHVLDAVELASGLTFKALHAGVTILNLMTVEDVCVHEGRVTGVVVNRTMISGNLHVDPIVFSGKAVLDGTGHDAFVVEAVRRRGLLEGTPAVGHHGEGPMDATSAEAFVVEKVAEVYPGLWVSGMSVSATFGGPRMGPIFGGMLLSGKRVAEKIAASIK